MEVLLRTIKVVTQWGEEREGEREWDEKEVIFWGQLNWVPI